MSYTVSTTIVDGDNKRVSLKNDPLPHYKIRDAVTNEIYVQNLTYEEAEKWINQSYTNRSKQYVTENGKKKWERPECYDEKHNYYNGKWYSISSM